jgi:uncharacterized protein
MFMYAVRMLIYALAVVLLGTGGAPAQAVPPDAAAAARELVVTMRADDQLRTILPLIMQQIKPAVVQNRPEVARDFDAIMPLMLEAMQARINDFVDATALIYAQNFAADDLREITAFYKGKAGQKFLQVMPAIAQQSLAMGQRLGQEIARDLQGRMTDELRKRGHKI